MLLIARSRAYLELLSLLFLWNKQRRIFLECPVFDLLKVNAFWHNATSYCYASFLMTPWLFGFRQATWKCDDRQILADASVDLVVVVVDFTCSCCGCCRFILSWRRMEMEHGPTPRPWQRDSHNTSLLSGVDAVRSVALPHTNEQKKSDKYSGRNSSSCCCCCMGPALPVQFWWGEFRRSDDVDVGSLYY